VVNFFYQYLLFFIVQQNRLLRIFANSKQHVHICNVFVMSQCVYSYVRISFYLIKFVIFLFHFSFSFCCYQIFLLVNKDILKSNQFE